MFDELVPTVFSRHISKMLWRYTSSIYAIISSIILSMHRSIETFSYVQHCTASSASRWRRENDFTRQLNSVSDRTSRGGCLWLEGNMESHNDRKLVENRSTKLCSSFVTSPAQEKLLALNDGKDRSGAFVIAEISGKQIWMEVGRFYDVNRIHQEPGRQIFMHRILAHETAEKKLFIGQPFLEKVRVTATVLYHFRGHKIRVLKHKPKKNYRKLQGHRQEMTRLIVDKIDILTDDVDTAQQAPNFLKGDPLYCLLQNIKRTQHPSLVLKMMKRQAMQNNKTPNTKEKREREDLERFDPALNFCIIENSLLY